MLTNEYATTACFSDDLGAVEELSATRRSACAWLEATGITREADSVVLLMNELITNALQHAPGAVRVRMLLRQGLLRCEVLDTHQTRPIPHSPGDEDEDGRGLQLVDALASRWGWVIADGGKVVWFDLPVMIAPRDPRSS
jgi:anti-sigma regulatory factor (Ser/Thr protein kinase)